MTTTKYDIPGILARAHDAAVRKMVHDFDAVEGDTLAKMIGEELHGGECPGPVPMWGTCFRVSDSADERCIRGLMEPLGPLEGGDMADLAEWARSNGVDMPDDAQDADLGDVRDALIESWRESGSDDVALADAGWHALPGGSVAVDVAGDIYIGVDGAGFSFYGNSPGDTHGIWPGLYVAMGRPWHYQMARDDVRATFGRAVEGMDMGAPSALVREARAFRRALKAIERQEQA